MHQLPYRSTQSVYSPTAQRQRTVRASAAQEPKRAFIFGLGYTGLAVASHLKRSEAW